MDEKPLRQTLNDLITSQVKRDEQVKYLLESSDRADKRGKNTNKWLMSILAAIIITILGGLFAFMQYVVNVRVQENSFKDRWESVITIGDLYIHECNDSAKYLELNRNFKTLKDSLEIRMRNFEKRLNTNRGGIILKDSFGLCRESIAYKKIRK
jgi:hypothetical protein